MLALDLREWEEIARLTQTDSKKIELTHRYIKDLFIKFEVVERKSHTNTQKYQLSEISSSPTVKPFKPIKYTQADKKSNGFQSHNQPIFYYYYYYTLIVCYSKMYWIYINDMCL